MVLRLMSFVLIALPLPSFGEDAGSADATRLNLRSNVWNARRPWSKSNPQNQKPRRTSQGDLEGLKNLRNEKAQAYIILTTEHDKLVEEVKKMELEKAQLEIDLGKAKEQEKLATEKLGPNQN